MKISDFDFKLDKNLIAQHPPKNRFDSRLLIVNQSTLSDQKFPDFLAQLQSNDIIVRNNTKVIPARLFGQKATGGKIEILLERMLDDSSALVLMKSSKSPKIGSIIEVNQIPLNIIGRDGQFFIIQMAGNIMSLFEKFGHMPLPPYIERNDEQSDQNRYQTVYAKNQGAVAAPTAGLHFDEDLLKKISDKGVETVEVTLHVGAGTFQPVLVDDTDDHKMHHEWVEITQETCDKIHEAKQKGGRVIAIGTTSLRVLESASADGRLKPLTGDTDIFITPPYNFHTVDLLLTNFHLPKSTLLMLVSAFAGVDEIKQAYRHAIDEKYRFFSYGDAMLLYRK